MKVYYASFGDNIGSINLVINRLHEFNILYITYPQKEPLFVKKCNTNFSL